jgi:predicted MFS family arabinose efflux permease
MSEPNKNYKWYILSLVVLTNMLVMAIPAMSMSVMSKEIARDLGLNLVQVGIIWGIGSLPGIFTSLLGGVIGDKLGPKLVLVVCSLAAGLLGAARGLAPDFLSMAVVVVLVGALIPFVTMNGFKTAGQWFPPSQLGLANGLISMGMALGFLLGSMFSATLLSPWLGGWRNVFIVYGLAGALFSIPWFFTRTLPTSHHASGQPLSMRKTIRRVASLKNIWLLGLTLFGVGGCIQGILGYLPLYLRGMGWETASASGALSAFHTTSMLFVLPIALWSDRLGSRKRLLLIAGALVALGAGLLSFASGGWVWVAVLVAGFVRDAFMAIFLTMVVETEGVGPIYAGTATGITMTINSLGNVLAPPLGNSLAVFWPGAPFAFWAAAAVFGLVCLSFVKSKPQHFENEEALVLENIMQ